MLNSRNLVSMLNSRETVGDDNRGAATRQLFKRLLHRFLALVIQSTRRLIKIRILGLLEKHARNGYALLLFARKTAAALTPTTVS